jgi:hypothetical protein
MIRQGATDNVLGFLSGPSGQDVLRIKDSVGGGNWEGYSATKTLQTYAIYLEARIVAYKNLRHDPIRVQSENNSNRMSMAGGGGGGGAGAGGRARKLNSLTVDKGLLREVREVQKIVGCLIQCRVSVEKRFFYVPRWCDAYAELKICDLAVFSSSISFSVLRR